VSPASVRSWPFGSCVEVEKLPLDGILSVSSHSPSAGTTADGTGAPSAHGIALLYLVFHATYVAQLHAIINRGPLADLDQAQYERLRADLIAAESTGLKPKLFDPLLSPYLDAPGTAAAWGYAAAFLCVTLLGIFGSVLAWRAGPVPDRRSAQSIDGSTQTD
jgi:hypothetical protein